MLDYRLHNGLKVITEHIPNRRSVAFGIWVKVGSRNEDEQNNGISHLIEHMLFKGTSTRSAKDIAEIFDGIGGNVNAFTSSEFTCFYVKVLDEHLPIAMDVLSDMFFHSEFNEEELDKEKNVIYEEIFRYEDTPDDLVHELISKAAFGQHSLGYPVLGLKDNLQNIKVDDLRKFMKIHYHIENTVICLAGNIQDSIYPLIEQYFGDFDNHGHAPIIHPPHYVGDLIFKEKKTEQNHLCLSLLGLSYKEESLYAVSILNNIMGGGMSSRLFQEIREKRGLAYSVYSYHSAYMDCGLFTFYIGSATKHLTGALDLMMDIFSDLINNGITDVELKKSKEQLKGSLMLSLESTSSRMNRLGKNELMVGRHDPIETMIAHIETIQPEQIQMLIHQLFNQPFSLSIVGNPDDAITSFRRDQLVH